MFRYAACVRHGLVPNLLDGGKNPRFNCRDAAWWFLQAVQDYYKIAGEGEGYKLLATQVDRLFGLPSKMPLAEVMQEILQAHASGIEFREEGAGQKLDSHMTSEGFNVRIRLDPGTGFVSGGSAHNCGTWMDKMGESETAGNKAQLPESASALTYCIVGSAGNAA
jgi:glycogen debranching enzyme